jgi:hypothetical protein
LSSSWMTIWPRPHPGPRRAHQRGRAAPVSRRPYPSTGAGCQHRHEVCPDMRNPARHTGFRPLVGHVPRGRVPLTPPGT